MLSLHCTTITKLAPLKKRQGLVNGANVFVFQRRATLDTFSLTAACCLSEAMAAFVKSRVMGLFAGTLKSPDGSD